MILGIYALLMKLYLPLKTMHSESWLSELHNIKNNEVHFGCQIVKTLAEFNFKEVQRFPDLTVFLCFSKLLICALYNFNTCLTESKND